MAPIAALLSLVALTGCAGAQFRLPAISDADVNRASLAVANEPSNLPKHYRTARENRDIVNRVAARLEAAALGLCAYAHTPRCTFNVVYVADDTVNAQTDGTRIEIYRGLLEYLDTEDEVAAVVGHEMGHEIAQHVEEKRQNAEIGAVLAGILMGGAMVASGSQDPDALDNSVGLGASLGALSFSKEEEREADLLSCYLLARANYDLEKAGRVWVVLSKMDDETHASWFDDHPAGPERVLGEGHRRGQGKPEQAASRVEAPRAGLLKLPLRRVCPRFVPERVQSGACVMASIPGRQGHGSQKSAGLIERGGRAH